MREELLIIEQLTKKIEIGFGTQGHSQLGFDLSLSTDKISLVNFFTGNKKLSYGPPTTTVVEPPSSGEDSEEEIVLDQTNVSNNQNSNNAHSNQFGHGHHHNHHSHQDNKLSQNQPAHLPLFQNLQPSFNYVVEKLYDPSQFLNLVQSQTEIPSGLLKDSHNPNILIVLANIEQNCTARKIVDRIDSILLRNQNEQPSMVQTFASPNFTAANSKFSALIQYQTLEQTFKAFDALQQMSTSLNNSQNNLPIKLFLAYDKRLLKEEDWVGVVLRNLPPDCSLDLLQRNFKSTNSYTILKADQPITIMNQRCALLHFKDIEQAERFCTQWNKFSFTENKNLKAHIHPMSNPIRHNSASSHHYIMKSQYTRQIQQQQFEGVPSGQERQTNKMIYEHVPQKIPTFGTSIDQERKERQQDLLKESKVLNNSSITSQVISSLKLDITTEKVTQTAQISQVQIQEQLVQLQEKEKPQIQKDSDQKPQQKELQQKEQTKIQKPSQTEQVPLEPFTQELQKYAKDVKEGKNVNLESLFQKLSSHQQQQQHQLSQKIFTMSHPMNTIDAPKVIQSYQQLPASRDICLHTLSQEHEMQQLYQRQQQIELEQLQLQQKNLSSNRNRESGQQVNDSGKNSGNRQDKNGQNTQVQDKEMPQNSADFNSFLKSLNVQSKQDKSSTNQNQKQLDENQDDILDYIETQQEKKKRLERELKKSQQLQTAVINRNSNNLNTTQITLDQTQSIRNQTSIDPRIKQINANIKTDIQTADTKESSQEEKLLGKRKMQRRLEELKRQEESKKRSESKVYQTNTKQREGQRLHNQSQSGSDSSSSQSDQEGSDESDGENDSNDSSSQEYSNSKSSDTIKRRARGRGKGPRVKRALNSSDEEDQSYFDPAIKKLKTDMKAEGSSNINASHKPKKRGRPSKKDLKEREKALKAQEKLFRQQKRQLEQVQQQQQQQRKLSNPDQQDISKINQTKLRTEELNSDEIYNQIQQQNQQISQPSTQGGNTGLKTGIKRGRGRPPKHSQSFSTTSHQQSNS
eukprot:403331058